MYMFQSKKQKKKLWSACLTRFQQYNQDNNVTPSAQPQRRHPPRPLRPQQQQQQRQLINTSRQQRKPSSMTDQWDSAPPPEYGQMKCSGRCCCCICGSILEHSTGSNNSSSQQQQLMYPLNTHQCVCSNNCFGGVADDASYPMEMESGSEEMSIEQDYETRTGGCYYESCGDNSTDCNEGGDYLHQFSNWSAAIEGLIAQRPLTNWQQSQIPQPLQETSTININNRSTTVMAAGNVLRNYCCAGGESVSNESSVGKCHHQQNSNQNYSLTNNKNNNAISTTPAHSTVTSAISATAASVFRHCCRGGISHSNESSIGSYPYPQDNRNYTLNNNAIGINNNNNSNSKNNYNCYEQKLTTTNDPADISKANELFKILMKKLKDSQLETLCQVVEKRCGTNANGSGGGVGGRTHQRSDCVLVSRESIAGEEPNVIACRLWSWPDLKSSMELKRTPMCPNGMEKVYVCCNPAHWNRILIPEAAPPPYQQSVMDRLNSEDRAPSEKSRDGGCSTVSTTTSGLRVQIPESFTTNGEDHSSPSLTWCQIAYWELAQRVGERYEAKNSTINIYSEGSGGMCLKDLAKKKCTANSVPTSSSVEKTRQKIGLGITLSQEADGVWLYNRSEAPIFVHSPTLNDDCRHVSKVPPGYCLNAFDKNRARAQKLVCPPQIAGAQTGPIDRFSMQISFAKGWGSKYRRTDITACHCWLEVLFSRR